MSAPHHVSITLASALLAALAALAACEPGLIEDPSLLEDEELAEGDDGADDDGKTDAYAASYLGPRSGFACQFTMPAGQKVSQGYLTMTVSYTTKPNCGGTWVGTDTLNLRAPNPGKTASLVSLNPGLLQGVTKGFTAGPNPKVLELRRCPDGSLPYYVEGPGWKFDIYSGGSWQCDYGATGCHENYGGTCSSGGAGGSTPPSNYECSTSWWEGPKCAVLGALALTTPGVRELWAAIVSGNVSAIIAILGTSLGQSALQAIGIVPGVDSCACVGSDVFGGCGLNLNEFMSYANDRLHGRAGAFCSYDR